MGTPVDLSFCQNQMDHPSLKLESFLLECFPAVFKASLGSIHLSQITGTGSYKTCVLKGLLLWPDISKPPLIVYTYFFQKSNFNKELMSWKIPIKMGLFIICFGQKLYLYSFAYPVIALVIINSFSFRRFK
ncbi:UNVERIFIED_CONTAM: hypothetical protein GTU68_047723 [Idotea baltica]|nr:hypothetical protein [Idotea baltica]